MTNTTAGRFIKVTNFAALYFGLTHDGHLWRRFHTWKLVPVPGFGKLVDIWLTVDTNGTVWLGGLTDEGRIWQCQDEAVVQMWHEVEGPR